MTEIYLLIDNDNKPNGVSVTSIEEANKFGKYKIIHVFDTSKEAEDYQNRLIDGEIIILSAPQSGASAMSGIYKKRGEDGIFTDDCYLGKMYHMYVLSDEDIYKDDWYYSKIHNQIFQCFHNEEYFEGGRKITAATDTKLDLPIIGQEFIDEYLKAKCNISKVQFKIVKMKSGVHKYQDVAVIYKK